MELGKKKLPVPVSQDFVVYAVQVDAAEDTITQLARQLTPTRRASFTKRGLI